jgi:hypothetical protein
MSATVLEASIDTKLAADPDYAAWTGRAGFKAQLLKAVSEAVVEHIQGLALVSGTTASACTAGGATGTCTATIS